jgi:hypothetical protein
MATFDQLPAQQRAIVELVLKRGQAYGDIAETLGLPEARVRELAREALIGLSPVTAGSVDNDWRGQLADYVLGQQTGPEQTATRGHLRRSETARAWVRSLVDSLDVMFTGERPVIPDAARDGGAPRERSRRGARARSDPAATAAPAQAPATEEKEAPKRAPSAPLSPAARAEVRRRRLIFGGGALALVLIAAAVLVWPVGLLTDDDDDGGGDTTTTPTTRVGQVVLRPVQGAPRGAAGIAVVVRQGRQLQLVVQATGLQATGEREAYEVWLYNDAGNARSLGAQVTDRNGTLQGAGPLPANYRDFRSIDLSRETIDNNTRHSNRSVLRGATSELQNPSGG